MKNFIDFMRSQGAIGLAIAFILGGAVSSLITSFVNDIVNPLVGILLSKASGITSASFILLGAEIRYGSFINALINFCVLAFVVYFFVVKLGLNKLDKKKE